MRNPWKFLSSYTEKDIINNQYKFIGRSKESDDLLSLIDNNLLVTLYGKCGSGKTSLLQAGVFPLLRNISYKPIVCRLKPGDVSAMQQFTETFLGNFEINKDENNVPLTETSFLEFTSKLQCCPVIVFDQFEDYLRNNYDYAVELIRFINNLVSDNFNYNKELYTNYRFVISIREDFLFLLEDIIDKLHLYELKENRYRLQPVNDASADEIISLGINQNTKTKKLSESIKKFSTDANGNIETNLLSLCCSELWYEYSGNLNDETIIDFEDKHLLKQYYERCVQPLSPKCLDFIENNLVYEGFRSSIDKDLLIKNIGQKNYDLLIEGNNKIFQTYSIGDKVYVELLHDKLVEPIVEKQHLKNEKYDFSIFYILLVILYLMSSVFYNVFLHSIFTQAYIFNSDFMGNTALNGIIKHPFMALDAVYLLISIMMPYILYLKFRKERPLYRNITSTLIIILSAISLYNSNLYSVYSDNLQSLLYIQNTMAVFVMIFALLIIFVKSDYFSKSHLTRYNDFWSIPKIKLTFGIWFLSIGIFVHFTQFDLLPNTLYISLLSVSIVLFSAEFMNLSLNKLDKSFFYNIALLYSLFFLSFAVDTGYGFVLIMSILVAIISFLATVLLYKNKDIKTGITRFSKFYALYFILTTLCVSINYKMNPVLLFKGRVSKIQENAVVIQNEDQYIVYDKSGSKIDNLMFKNIEMLTTQNNPPRLATKIPLQSSWKTLPINDYNGYGLLFHISDKDSINLILNLDMLYFINELSHNNESSKLTKYGFTCSKEERNISSVNIEFFKYITNFESTFNKEKSISYLTDLAKHYTQILDTIYGNGITKTQDIVSIEKLYTKHTLVSLLTDAIERNDLESSCRFLELLDISTFSNTDILKNHNITITIDDKYNRLERNASFNSKQLNDKDLQIRNEAIHNEWLFASTTALQYNIGYILSTLKNTMSGLLVPKDTLDYISQISTTQLADSVLTKFNQNDANSHCYKFIVQQTKKLQNANIDEELFSLVDLRLMYNLLLSYPLNDEVTSVKNKLEIKNRKYVEEISDEISSIKDIIRIYLQIYTRGY